MIKEGTAIFLLLCFIVLPGECARCWRCAKGTGICPHSGGHSGFPCCSTEEGEQMPIQTCQSEEAQCLRYRVRGYNLTYTHTRRCEESEVRACSDDSSFLDQVQNSGYDYNVSNMAEQILSLPQDTCRSFSPGGTALSMCIEITMWNCGSSPDGCEDSTKNILPRKGLSIVFFVALCPVAIGVAVILLYVVFRAFKPLTPSNDYSELQTHQQHNL